VDRQWLDEVKPSWIDQINQYFLNGHCLQEQKLEGQQLKKQRLV
jgi:hypothetical protein